MTPLVRNAALLALAAITILETLPLGRAVSVFGFEGGTSQVYNHMLGEVQANMYTRAPKMDGHSDEAVAMAEAVAGVLALDVSDSEAERRCGDDAATAAVCDSLLAARLVKMDATCLADQLVRDRSGDPASASAAIAAARESADSCHTDASSADLILGVPGEFDSGAVQQACSVRDATLPQKLPTLQSRVARFVAARFSPLLPQTAETVAQLDRVTQALSAAADGGLQRLAEGRITAAALVDELVSASSLRGAVAQRLQRRAVLKSIRTAVYNLVSAVFSFLAASPGLLAATTFCTVWVLYDVLVMLAFRLARPIAPLVQALFGVFSRSSCLVSVFSHV